MIPLAVAALLWSAGEDEREAPRAQLADLFNLDPRLSDKIDARGRWRGTAHWMWTGAKQKGGDGRGDFYGRLQRRRGVLWLAHRYVWTLLVGKIPADHDVHHLCGETLCVNPAHLEALHRDEHAAHHAELDEWARQESAA